MGRPPTPTITATLVPTTCRSGLLGLRMACSSATCKKEAHAIPQSERVPIMKHGMIASSFTAIQGQNPDSTRSAERCLEATRLALLRQFLALHSCMHERHGLQDKGRNKAP